MKQQIQDFLTYLKIAENRSVNTLKAYESDLVAFSTFEEENGKADVKDVSKIDVLAYLEKLADDGNGPATRSRKLSSIKAFFEYLYNYEIVPRNITAGIKAPKLPKKTPVVASGDEAKKLIEASFKVGKTLLSKFRNKAIFYIMFSAGLRRQEVIDLDVSGVDLETGYLLVHGKGDKERIVYINQDTCTSISEYLKFRNEVSGSVEEKALFITSKAKRLGVCKINVLMEQAKQEAGIDKHYTPHTCRKTCATLLMEGGENIRTIQEILGHSNIQTTTIYTSVSNKTKEEAGRNFRLN